MMEEGTRGRGQGAGKGREPSPSSQVQARFAPAVTVAVKVVGYPRTVGPSLTTERPLIGSSITVTTVVAVSRLTLLLAVTAAV